MDESSALHAVEETTGTALGPLYAGDEVLQRFDVAADHLVGIRLLIGTYGRRPETLVRVAIHDEMRSRCLREVVVDARSFDDNQWQLFPFPPLEERGRRLAISFRSEGTDEHQAVALWLDSRSSPRATRNGALAPGAICFTPRYAEACDTALDPVLFEPDAVPPMERPEAVHDLLRRCLLAADIAFLRLVHLADGVRRARRELGVLRRALSIGAGLGYQEAFLAARIADLEIVASDLQTGYTPDGLPNLRWEHRDILTWEESADYDLVISIECLEHIADPVRAFRNMARKVRHGGCLYLSVPFASAAEQADPELRRQEWERHEHHRPGFSVEDLGDLFAANGFRVVHATSMFRGALAARVHRLLDSLSSTSQEIVLGEAARLLLHDLDGPLFEHRHQATGIRVLGLRVD